MVVGHCLFYAVQGIANVEVFHVLDRVAVQYLAVVGEGCVEGPVRSCWSDTVLELIEHFPDAFVLATIFPYIFHVAEVVYAYGRAGYLRSEGVAPALAGGLPARLPRAGGPSLSAAGYLLPLLFVFTLSLPLLLALDSELGLGEGGWVLVWPRHYYCAGPMWVDWWVYLCVVVVITPAAIG